MNNDEIKHVCAIIYEADDTAMVAASEISLRPDGHVTVVHEAANAPVIDAALDEAGLRSKRINSTRTKVYRAHDRQG